MTNFKFEINEEKYNKKKLKKKEISESNGIGKNEEKIEIKYNSRKYK